MKKIEMEISRIDGNIAGEIPSGKTLKIDVHTQNAETSLSKVKEVIRMIAKYNANNWPIDEEWEVILPDWFLDKIKSNTVEQIIKDLSLWHFGSWLDAMKYRGWEWYSSELLSDRYAVFFEAIDFPYSINPLEYVIVASGVPLDNIHFTEEF